MSRTKTATLIKRKCNDIAKMLIEKNKSYGDSALRPARVFSHLAPIEGLKIRMDDKISRIQNNPEAFGEDPVMDLMGYCIFYLIEIDLLNSELNAK